jgi:hypothetical protein
MAECDTEFFFPLGCIWRRRKTKIGREDLHLILLGDGRVVGGTRRRNGGVGEKEVVDENILCLIY